MDFLQTLEAHRGSLLHIKSELFWYGGRGWDVARGRICLLLDAEPDLPRGGPAAATTAALALVEAVGARGGLGVDAAVLLLIDGAPHWVWVCQEDVEIL